MRIRNQEVLDRFVDLVPMLPPNDIPPGDRIGLALIVLRGVTAHGGRHPAFPNITFPAGPLLTDLADRVFQTPGHTPAQVELLAQAAAEELGHAGTRRFFFWPVPDRSSLRKFMSGLFVVFEPDDMGAVEDGEITLAWGSA